MEHNGNYHEHTYITENVCLEVRIVKARSEDELYKKVNELLSSDSGWSVVGPLRTTELGYSNKFSYSIKLKKTKPITYDHGTEIDKIMDDFVSNF